MRDRREQSGEMIIEKVVQNRVSVVRMTDIVRESHAQMKEIRLSRREIQPKLREIIREDQEREEIMRASKLPGIQKIQTKEPKVLANPTLNHLRKLQVLKAFLANFLDRKKIHFLSLKIISQ